MMSLVSGAIAASSKYCGSAVFNKDGKRCCSKANAWDSASAACANDGSYIKIHKNCGSNRRRVKRICCDSVNAWHGCSSPTPAPTLAPTSAPTPAPTLAPTPTPPSPTPPPSSAAYASSSSRYYPEDTGNTTAGQVGACGGAVLDTVASKLSALTGTVGMHYFPVAIAQGMAQPLMCSTADESTGLGSPSIIGAGYSNVLHTYCGQCIEFTTSEGTTVGGVVLDTCPYESNKEWCSKDGSANQHGFYNHVDIFGSSETDVKNVVGSNPTGSVKTVTCPAAVTEALTSVAAATQQSPKSEVCTWYYDGSKWQGSPGMSDFGCSECSNDRRLSLTSSVFV